MVGILSGRALASSAEGESRLIQEALQGARIAAQHRQLRVREWDDSDKRMPTRRWRGRGQSEDMDGRVLVNFFPL